MNIAANVYDITIKGYVKTPGASSGGFLRLNAQNSTGTAITPDSIFQSGAIANTAGAAFTIGGEIAAGYAAATNLRLTVSSAAVNYTFVITDITVVNKGPR